MKRKEVIIATLMAFVISEFFLFTNKTIGLHFSWIATFFILTISLSISFFIISLSKKTSIICCGILLLALITYTFVSVGFFRVFGTFDFSSSVGVPIKQLPSFIFEYRRYVPLRLFAAGALVLFFSFFSIWYLKIKKSIMNGNELQNSNNKLRKRGFYTALIFQFSAFGFAFYLSISPVAQWFSVRNKMEDLGVIGALYMRIARATRVNANNQTADKLNSSKSKFKNVRELFSKLQSKNLSQQLIPYDFSSNSVRPNIVVFQLESIPAWAVEKSDAMPFFRSLREKSLNVSNFFPNSCHTINAEFTSVCSLFSPSKGAIQSEDIPDIECLPEILKKEYNYTTGYYHTNVPEYWQRDKIGPKIGFEKLFFTPHYGERAPDGVVLEEIVNTLKNARNPQFMYVISHTSHSPHVEEIMADQKKRYNYIISKFEGKIDEKIIKNIELDEYALRVYLGYVNAVDNALKEFFSDLEKENLLDKTAVIIFGDHRFYNFLTQTAEDWMNYNEIPFVFLMNGIGGNIDSISTHLDIAPTLLNLVEGNSYKRRDQFLGKSLFESSRGNFALMSCHNSIDYYNGVEIVQGDSTTGVYVNFDYNSKLSENSDSINDLIIFSDALLK